MALTSFTLTWLSSPTSEMAIVNTSFCDLHKNPNNSQIVIASSTKLNSALETTRRWIVALQNTFQVNYNTTTRLIKTNPPITDQLLLDQNDTNH